MGEAGPERKVSIRKAFNADALDYLSFCLGDLLSFISPAFGEVDMSGEEYIWKLLTVLACIVFSYWRGRKDVIDKLREEAIERDYALWHPKTRKFIWKNDYDCEKDKNPLERLL